MDQSTISDNVFNNIFTTTTLTLMNIVEKKSIVNFGIMNLNSNLDNKSPFITLILICVLIQHEMGVNS